MLEIPVDEALTAKAWLAAAATPLVIAEKDVESTALVNNAVGSAMVSRISWLYAGADADADACPPPPPAAEATSGQRSELDVWFTMLQALRGLAAVHAVSEESTHRAVCLGNILVAARPTADTSVAGGSSSSVAYLTAADNADTEKNDRLPYFFAPHISSSLYPLPPCDIRRAQLGPPAPASLARPPVEYLAPEILRGKPFRQPADVYAFGVLLQAACCGGEGVVSGRTKGKNGSEVVRGGVLPSWRGPSEDQGRQALSQVLESMLEEDPSRRCSAVEVCLCAHV